MYLFVVACGVADCAKCSAYKGVCTECSDGKGVDFSGTYCTGKFLFLLKYDLFFQLIIKSIISSISSSSSGGGGGGDGGSSSSSSSLV